MSAPQPVTNNDAFTLDLPAYFARIGFNGQPRADLATLRALLRAHTTSVPFENVDVILGRPIRLDLPSLQAKLVTARRGGYCFEQNGLFSAVLERLGFVVTRLAARVRLGTTRVLPRTHMILLVKTENGPHLADAGFGGWGMLEPLPLNAGQEIRQGAWTFRLEEKAGLWVLQCLECPLGPDQYAFTLEPQLPIDYEIANHYCATHPDSRFVQTMTVQLPSPTVRTFLRNNELVVVKGTDTRTEVVADEAALRSVLADRFGLVFPDDVRVPLKV